MNILRDLVLFCSGAALALIVQTVASDLSTWRFRRRMGAIHGWPWKRIAQDSKDTLARFRDTGRQSRVDIGQRHWRGPVIVTPRGRVRDH